MNKFKKGDKVVCVNNTAHGNKHSLTVGCTYTVLNVDHSQLWVMDDQCKVEGGVGRYKDQFELLPNYPNKPHKHAELIKAWADGAAIQHQSLGKEGVWYSIGEPAWCPFTVYRIKPTPAPTIPIVIDGKTVELSLESAIAVKEALKDL